MLVSLKELLPEAANSSGAIACVNVFGFEDAQAIIAAAEALGRPVILATNKDMVEMLGVKSLAGLLLPLIENSTAKICLHLDHCYDEAIVYQAMQAGYSSVMFDGSQLLLAENIRRTQQVVAVAKSLGVSVEGEIGSVPYHEGRDHIKTRATEVEEAKTFSEQSGVDAVAVSVGNVHRLPTPSSVIDYNLLEEIEAQVKLPLVIHGTTGIKQEDLLKLKSTRVAKFNIGTSLRQVIGNSLRKAMAAEPQQFDRSYFMRQIQPQMLAEAKRILQLLA